jgi:ABC-type nitrate/sulfonate/bicarbonate transport system permease component
MLPSPIDVASALVNEFPELLRHAIISLQEAFLGLALGIAIAFTLAALMDKSELIYSAIHPILLLTQTIPPIAIAPLLVLWMGYGIAPKVALIFLVCFFPITISLLEGFRSSDTDAIALFRSMGANEAQIFWHIKLPYAQSNFFAGLKVAVSYAIVGAVIAEWLGGDSGLGVYMIRVRKSYSFDRMFAVILFISLLSIALMQLTMFIQRKSTPWKQK